MFQCGKWQEALGHSWTNGIFLKNTFEIMRFLLAVQFSRSVMSDSMWPHGLPGLPVHHQLPGFTQTHVHWVGDAIQPSHPLSSTSPTFNLSQHQGLFKWVSSLHQVAKVLEFHVAGKWGKWNSNPSCLGPVLLPVILFYQPLSLEHTSDLNICVPSWPLE